MRSYFATERFFFVRAVSPPSDDRKAPPLGQATLDSIPPEKWAELRKRASLLRSAGRGPLSKVSAKRLARALKVHWTTVYRWHQRFREARTVSSLAARGVGFPTKKTTRLSLDQERIIDEVLASARRRSTPARVVEIVAEVRRLCAAKRVRAPTRRSIDRRIQRSPQVSVHRRDAAAEVRPAIAPGTFRVNQPLEVVQIDHTKADLMVVDELFRRPIGRPTLTIVMDVASRAVLAPVVSFEAPSATTVAYALARACAPKADWLASLGMTIDWPMQGLPASLHLDNAPEFHSRALERGCAELGIELVYRPRGRPHFGGCWRRFGFEPPCRLPSEPRSEAGSPVMARPLVSWEWLTTSSAHYTKVAQSGVGANSLPHRLAQRASYASCPAPKSIKRRDLAVR